ncbi:phosphodiester glycosidase family protein [Sphingomonas mesophila]|uniref:phosphodiester glycosidase family protein n=1 Tax=Sphingomonas mesophila TaxID=2303576 RepID=UPI000E587347|nr:phosphodiester glycosidase family protein [Sphingomonas mesophila]
MRCLLVLLMVAGCSAQQPAARVESPCRERAFEGSAFVVCDPGAGRMMLFAAGKNEKPFRRFAELPVDPDRVAFAMNAGMFDEEGRPIGLAVTHKGPVRPLNLRDGPGNFHLKPNGVFIVPFGGGGMIVPSDSIPVFRAAPQLQTQSGPMLVIDGKLHPKIAPDGDSRYVRNAVGVRDGKALFVISLDVVSLGKLARFFRDELKTPDALYLDGSVSSLWDPANGRMDDFTELGPMIVAFKAGASAPGRGGPATP